MPISVKPDSWRGESTPWIKKPDNTWAKATKVFLKVAINDPNVPEQWVEVWPLLPGQATSLALSQVFRNDRIEYDFSWTAPVGGSVPPARYSVSVFINGGLYGTYSITAPTTSFTLTNNGSGFQAYAQQQVSFTVTPISIDNRPAPVASSGNYTAITVPAPPAPTGFAISMTEGVLYQSFAQVSGSRIIGVEMVVTASNGQSGVYYFGPGTTNTSQFPWNVAAAAAAGGLTFDVSVRAYGPGGYSSTQTLSGVLPGDPNVYNARFTNGGLTYYTSNSPFGTSLDHYWQQEAGALNFYKNGPANVGVANHAVPASSGWARDQSRYRVAVQPRCTVGGNASTGRTVFSTYVRKMPNPFYFVPTGANTYTTSGGWKNAQYIYQGLSFGIMHHAYVYYGNTLRDTLGDGNVGFHLNISGAEVAIGRWGGIGSNAPTSLTLWLHTGASEADGFVSLTAGGQVLPALSFEEQQWQSFDKTWARYLIDQTNGWRGIGFYSSDPQIDPSTGQGRQLEGVYRPDANILGVPGLTMRVYHDG